MFNFWHLILFRLSSQNKSYLGIHILRKGILKKNISFPTSFHKQKKNPNHVYYVILIIAYDEYFFYL